MQKPASSTAKVKKLLLFPGDPLIKTLKPDYYLIVDPGSLQASFDASIDQNPDDFAPDEDDEEEEDSNELKAPSLSDITLVRIRTKINLLNLYLMLKIVAEVQ